MKPIYIIGILFLLSCSDEKENKRPEKQLKTPDKTESINLDSLNGVKLSIHNKRLNFNVVDHLFKLSNIQQVDSLNSFEKKEFRRLTEKEYFAAFQDSSEYYYDPEYNGAYYYSNQGEWNDLKRYIFVKEDETCCTYYYYNIYDKTGKKTSSFIFEASGGDGGWVINEGGFILNDSTIKSTTVECEYGIDEAGKEMGDCDSVIIVINLLNDGTINEVIESKHKIKK